MLETTNHDPSLTGLPADEEVRIRSALGAVRDFAIEVGGRRIGVLRAGKVGIPLVLMHSIGLDRWAWLRVLPHVCDSRQVLALDLPLHGRDGAGPAAGFNEFCAATIAAIEALGVGPVDLCGLSFGGTIALEIGLKRPDLVRRLIVSAAVADGFPAARLRAEAGSRDGVSTQIEETLRRWFTEEEGRVTCWQVGFAAQRLGRMSRDNWASAWNALAEAKLSSRLHALSRPLTLIAGERDVSVPPAAMQQIAALVPQARLVTIPGAPHQVALSKPAEFAAALLEGAGA